MPVFCVFTVYTVFCSKIVKNGQKRHFLAYNYRHFFPNEYPTYNQLIILWTSAGGGNSKHRDTRWNNGAIFGCKNRKILDLAKNLPEYSQNRIFWRVYSPESQKGVKGSFWGVFSRPLPTPIGFGSFWRLISWFFGASFACNYMSSEGRLPRPGSKYEPIMSISVSIN